MPRQPYDYHPPEHPPEDQSWGWWVVIAFAAFAVAAGVLLAWPAALAVVGVGALGLMLRRVRRSRSTRNARSAA